MASKGKMEQLVREFESFEHQLDMIVADLESILYITSLTFLTICVMLLSFAVVLLLKVSESRHAHDAYSKVISSFEKFFARVKNFIKCAVLLGSGATLVIEEEMTSTVAMERPDSPKKMSWAEIAQEKHYEGAGILLVSEDDEILFLISLKDDGQKQAEFPGGKPKMGDFSAWDTARRELFEEAGVPIDYKLSGSHEVLETNGGTTGFPSFQIVVRNVPKDIEVSPSEKFVDAFWSKLYKDSNEKWYVKDGDMYIKVRTFNTYCFDQNEEKLSKFIKGRADSDSSDSSADEKEDDVEDKQTVGEDSVSDVL